MKSVLQKEKQCWLCGSRYNLHLHHVYGAGCRKNSTKYGLTVYLCQDHHTGVNGVHSGTTNGKALDELLRRYAQSVFEETHTREEFIRLFIRSNL